MKKYETLRLEKGMYEEPRRTFSQVLEHEDPSDKYINTPLEGLDAYQRQLKRFDIKVRGTHSDPVEKFFTTKESSVLFPEFVARAVRHGMEDDGVLRDISATITEFDGSDYRSATSENVSKKLDDGSIPETSISEKSNPVRLHKRGRMLITSYEHIRLQRLDAFYVILRQIGKSISRAHLEDAIRILLNGDDEGKPAEKIKYTGTPRFEDVLRLWTHMDPYQMNTMLVSSNMLLRLQRVEELQNSGRIVDPLADTKIIRTSVVPFDIAIGLDRNYALEQVISSDISVEYDKLIDKKLERSTITSTAGFNKLFPGASLVLAPGSGSY